MIESTFWYCLVAELRIDALPLSATVVMGDAFNEAANTRGFCPRERLLEMRFRRRKLSSRELSQRARSNPSSIDSLKMRDGAQQSPGQIRVFQLAGIYG